MTVEDIIQSIRDNHGGAWWALFHATKDGHKFLPSGHVLTPAAYAAVVRAFASPKIERNSDLTLAERKVNALRHRAQRGNG